MVTWLKKLFNKEDFDYVENGSIDPKIQYGVVKGSNTIVHIKAGAMGSLYGYENKYLRIAQNINSKYGYTVICASNPLTVRATLEDSMNYIENYCKKMGFNDYQIYYMGVSNGGNFGMWCGAQYEKIKRMLIVNAPITINLHKTKETIANFLGEKITFVYGSRDESINSIELLEGLSDIVQIEIIEGADHQFTGMLDEFINLPEKYLL